MAEDSELKALYDRIAKLEADNKLANDRVTKLEKSMVEHVTGSGGTPGALQTAIKRKAGAEDTDRRFKELRDAIEMNGKFDAASRELIDGLTALMEGDELAPGIRSRLLRIEQGQGAVDAVVLKVNGDGTESNKGLADRFTRVEADVNTSQTRSEATARTLYGVLVGFGGVGLSIFGFFWNYLSGGITSNETEISALQAKIHQMELQQEQDRGTLGKLETRTTTDREWAEKALEYIKK